MACIFRKMPYVFLTIGTHSYLGSKKSLRKKQRMQNFEYVQAYKSLCSQGNVICFSEVHCR